MTNTDNSPNPQHDPADQLDQLRAVVPAVDPAALTGADVLALLDLLHGYYRAAGIE
jgi:hypothetical protein